MKVLMVEDDSKIGKFLQQGLNEEGYAVVQATTLSEGFRRAGKDKFDVAVIDLNLPDGDGLTLIERLRAEGHHFPILVLSARTSVAEKVAGLQAGGDDYLVKPFAFSELVARLRALVRRAKGGQASTVFNYGPICLDLSTRAVSVEGKPMDLQPLEFSLLQYFMESPEIALSKTSIIQQVWKFNFHPSTNIVESRISKLREKLAEAGAPDLIHTIRGVGYMLKTQP